MHYEVEVKSLLGSEENVTKLRACLRAIDPACALTASGKQLNHYFEGGNLQKIAEVVKGHLSPEARATLEGLAQKATNFSVRTRDKDGAVLLVAKVSVGSDTSANGVARMEFEEQVDLSLAQLDQLLLDAGFSYQAKWSREREEYMCNGIAVCLDRNAGYGWLAEFEKVVESEAVLYAARQDIDTLMHACAVEELPQARLERMFAFYNAHWPEYYGTDNVFTIQ